MTNTHYPTHDPGRSIPVPAVVVVVGLGGLWLGGFVRAAGTGFLVEGFVIAAAVVACTLGALSLLGRAGHSGEWRRGSKVPRRGAFAGPDRGAFAGPGHFAGPDRAAPDFAAAEPDAADLTGEDLMAGWSNRTGGPGRRRLGQSDNQRVVSDFVNPWYRHGGARWRLRDHQTMDPMEQAEQQDEPL